MKEDILKNALEASLNNEFDELSMADIPDYDFSPEFLNKMDDLVKSQEKPPERNHFKAVWITAMSAAVAAVCIIAGAYNENYISRIPEQQTEIITAENAVTTVSSDSAHSAMITTLTTKNDNTAVSEKTNVSTAAVSTSARTEKTASATSAKQTSSAARTTRTSDTTAPVASSASAVRTSATAVPVTVVTTVSLPETTAVTSVTTDKGESDMKKYSKKKYAALISAISIAAGSSGIVSSAENNIPVVNDEATALLYIAENPTLMDFDGNGEFNTYDAYAALVYLYDKAVLPAECAEKVEKNADVNNNGEFDGFDVDLLVRYCYQNFVKGNYDAVERDTSSYPYNSDYYSNLFVSQFDSLEKYGYDAYYEMEFLKFIRKIDLGEIDLDFNCDGKADLYDLYDVYLYTILSNENSLFNSLNNGKSAISEQVNIDSAQIDRIFEKCKFVYVNNEDTDDLNLIARYILTHNDITVEATTAEYYTVPYGSIELFDVKVEEHFVNCLMNWMKMYVNVNQKFDKYEIKTIGDFVYREYSDHIEIYSYSGNSETIEIPSEIDGCPVTVIGAWTFKDNKAVHNFVLPDTITEIQQSAFEGCSNIGEIKFPENLKIIGELAFNDTGLEKVRIPDSVTEIGSSAFSNSRSLLEAVLPEKNVELGSGIFGNCQILKKVTLPVDCALIPPEMFKRCSTLKQVEIPSSVTRIGYGAFEYCSELESVNLPDGIQKIDDYAFYWCYALKEINLSESLNEIGRSAFYACTSLTEITVPGSVKVIKDNTFCCCESLEKIELKEGIKSIEMNAFSVGKETKLESVTIPKSVDALALNGFSNIKTLNVYDENGELHSVENTNKFLIVDPKSNNWDTAGKISESISWTLDGNGTLTISGEGAIPDFTTGMFAGAMTYSPFFQNENIKKVIIEEGITDIGNYTFAGCENLESVSLPSTLKNISMGSFQQTGLTEVTIPDGVEIIYPDSFAACDKLKKVTLPDSLTMIGFSAFNGCEELSTINIPENVDSIGDYAFADCWSLKSINIPDKVEHIYFRTFMECDALEDITFGKGITKVEDNAFKDTKWLADRKTENSLVIVNDIVIDGRECTGNIVIPDGVKYIADNAFEESKITGIVMPDSVLSIGMDAFLKCSNLSSVKLSQKLSYIEEEAFCKCISLKSIELPDSLTELNIQVFSECGNLEKVILPQNITKIDFETFYKCGKLESIFIPKGIIEISEDAFEECNKLTIQSDDNVYIRKYAEKQGIKFEYTESAPVELQSSGNPSVLSQITAGDANCDGSVNMADVVLIMQSIANPDKFNINGSDATHITAQGTANADMDGNGITNNDALAIQKKLLDIK